MKHVLTAILAIDDNHRSVEKLAVAVTTHVPDIAALFEHHALQQTLIRAEQYQRERAKRLFGYDFLENQLPGGGLPN